MTGSDKQKYKVASSVTTGTSILFFAIILTMMGPRFTE